MVFSRIVPVVGVLALAGIANAQPAASPPPVAPSQAIASARELGLAFTTVADRVSPSVVSVRVEARMTPQQMPPFGPFGMMPPQNDGIARGNGSGVILRADGFVLTNNHVIENAIRVEVELQDGRRFPATVVGTDPATDLAVVRIQATGLPVARFGDSRGVRPGQWAIAIGSPFGLDYTVTTGVVSSVGRAGLGINEIEDYIQTDASINPGNSGGPLVDLDGEVIGINTMIVGRGSGIGFAVSSELARRVASQLIDHGRVRRAWIGVQFQEMTPELAAAFSLGQRARAGALIADVVRNGPAARAGLRPGDIVIEVDGQPVREGRDLLRAILLHDIGTQVRLTVTRGGQRRNVMLGTEERPGAQRPDRPSAPLPAPVPSGSGPAEGLVLRPLTGPQRQQIGSEGALVADLQRGSDADRAGLRPGDVIVEADGRAVSSPANVHEALNDRRAVLRVRRQEGAFYTVLAD